MHATSIPPHTRCLSSQKSHFDVAEHIEEESGVEIRIGTRKGIENGPGSDVDNPDSLPCQA